MLNHTKRWIELTFSGLSFSEFWYSSFKFFAILWICMDGDSAVYNGWFLKFSWVFFPRCFEIFCLYWIMSHKAVNCTQSRFGFRRWTVHRIKVWPFQRGIPFIPQATEHRVLCYCPFLTLLIMIYLQMWENLSTKNGDHILKIPVAALNFDHSLAAIIHVISSIRGFDNDIRF